MAFIVPVVRSDFTLYNTGSLSPSILVSSSNSSGKSRAGRPQTISSSPAKTKMDLSLPPRAVGERERSRLDHKDNTTISNTAVNNTTHSNTVPNLIVAYNQRPRLHFEKNLTPPYVAPPPPLSTSATNDGVGDSTPSPPSALKSSRRISIPPIDRCLQANNTTKPETPTERRVHFGFYEEISYKEEESAAEEALNGEEDIVDGGKDPEAIETNPEASETNPEASETNQAEKNEGEVESEDYSVFTWSCPDKLYKTRRRALSTPATAGQGPTMITNETVAAMLRSKRDEEKKSERSDDEYEGPAEDKEEEERHAPSSPPVLRPRCSSNADEKHRRHHSLANGAASGVGSAARKYSIGFLRMVGLYHPSPKSGTDNQQQ